MRDCSVERRGQVPGGDRSSVKDLQDMAKLSRSRAQVQDGSRREVEQS